MSNYSRALEFCIENGIQLDSIDTNLLQVYIEGANIEYTKKYKEISKYFKNYKKRVNTLIKVGKYKEAKQECEVCKKKLAELQKEVNNIKSNNISNTISVLIPTLITAGAAIGGALSLNSINKKYELKNKNLNNYYKGVKDEFKNDVFNGNKTTNDYLADLNQIDKAESYDMDKNLFKTAVKGTIALGATIPTVLITSIKALKNLYKDCKDGHKIIDANTFRGAANNLIKNCYKALAKIEERLG